MPRGREDAGKASIESRRLLRRIEIVKLLMMVGGVASIYFIKTSFCQRRFFHICQRLMLLFLSFVNFVLLF